MYFTPGNHKDHGLHYNPLKAIIAPRPIGWIASVDGQGRPNLAPYSFFNAISVLPPMVGFSSSPSENGEKDSLANIRETGEFTVNIVSKKQMDAMNLSSAPLPHGQSEFDFAKIESEPSIQIAPPRVKGAPCHLECKLWQILPLPPMAGGMQNHWVMGIVVGIHIDEHVITDGRVDVTKYSPIARLGYKDYAAIDTVFEMEPPKA